jgi:hypothetical protein
MELQTDRDSRHFEGFPQKTQVFVHARSLDGKARLSIRTLHDKSKTQRAVEEALQEGLSRPAKSAEGAETASRNWRQLQPQDGRKRPPLVLVHEVCTLISGRKGSGTTRRRKAALFPRSECAQAKHAIKNRLVPPSPTMSGTSPL